MTTKLTKRELEYLSYATLTYDQIAKLLGVSHHTVRHTLSRIYLKLGIGGEGTKKGTALALALQRGLLRAEDVHPGDARMAGEVW